MFVRLFSEHVFLQLDTIHAYTFNDFQTTLGGLTPNDASFETVRAVTDAIFKRRAFFGKGELENVGLAVTCEVVYSGLVRHDE